MNKIVNEIGSFTNSVNQFFANGMPCVEPSVLEHRMDICKSCDQWDAQALGGTGRCRKCGCSTWAKLRMATESCPIGKWEAVDISNK